MTLERLGALRLQLHQPWSSIDFLGDVRALATLLVNSTRALRSFDALSAPPELHRIAVIDYSGHAIANTSPVEGVSRLSLQYPVDEPDVGELVRAFPNTRDANLGGLTRPKLSAFADWPLEDLLLQRCMITDLRPLADLELDLRLDRGTTYRGIDDLGPGVRVRYVN